MITIMWRIWSPDHAINGQYNRKLLLNNHRIVMELKQCLGMMLTLINISKTCAWYLTLDHFDKNLAHAYAILYWVVGVVWHIVAWGEYVTDRELFRAPNSPRLPTPQERSRFRIPRNGALNYYEHTKSVCLLWSTMHVNFNFIWQGIASKPRSYRGTGAVSILLRLCVWKQCSIKVIEQL